MVLIRDIVPTLLGVNILIVGILAISQLSQTTTPYRTLSMQTDYHFDDLTAAYQVLSKLDVFSVVEADDLEGSKYHAIVDGSKGDFHYCENHRAHFVAHPETFFDDHLNFVTSLYAGHKIRKQVIPLLGVDQTAKYDKKLDKYTEGIQTNTDIFFHFTLMFYRRQVGKQFSCLSQASNHIPGHEKLYRKDLVSQALVDYAKGYKARPQCFSYDKYFPKTWILTDKEQCQAFFKEFNSPLYKKMKKERNIVYFRKIGANVHEGKGVFPVTDEEETYIRELYNNGKLCGQVTKNNLIQYNVHNLLLVENRKFGFRSFMLVASTNPLIAYYHDGYARLSLNEYDSGSKERSTFVTNIGVNVKNPAFQSWNKQQIDDFTYWPLEKFGEYLYEKGIVQDPEWLENHLRREFMKVKIHLLRMSQSGFFKVSSLFEIYGIDYVMDENLNLWFIEANTMPLINGFTEHSTWLMNHMLLDTFDIVSGLIKSRMKRAIFYVNNLVKQYGKDIPNLKEKRAEFREITKNYFEEEFKPRANSTFYPIVDENRVGKDRYFGLIEEECLSYY